MTDLPHRISDRGIDDVCDGWDGLHENPRNAAATAGAFAFALRELTAEERRLREVIRSACALVDKGDVFEAAALLKLSLE